MSVEKLEMIAQREARERRRTWVGGVGLLTVIALVLAALITTL
jgi:hypothetical protein